MIWLIIAFLTLIVIIYVTKIKRNTAEIIGIMDSYSVHIWGFKKTGKDLLTQIYIYNKHKKNKSKVNYLSVNVDYGYGCKKIDFQELKIYTKDNGENKEATYQDFIDNKNLYFAYQEEYEGKRLIVSDVGIYLPNTEHNYLDKKYPSLPIFFAISEHLYNMPIITNSQELTRPWVKLRNMSDFYIKALHTVPKHHSVLKKIWKYLPILRHYLFLKIRLYDKIESAENGILPFKDVSILKNGLLGRPLTLTPGQATKEQFKAEHGTIKEMTVYIPIKAIKYDSRYFKSLIKDL